MVTLKKQKLTPPEVAKLFGVEPGKVIAWVKNGELRAINGATRNTMRPRYLIDVSDIAAFEQRRAIVPPASPPPRQRRSAASGVTEFF